MELKTIKKSVKYRDLGGKSISIEKTLTKKQIVDEANKGNWACYNFIDRRNDFQKLFDTSKFYYVHAEDGLGYVICEDELEAI